MTKFLDRLQELKLKMASVPVNVFIIGTFIVLILDQINYKLSETILSILITGAISIVTTLLSHKETKTTETTEHTETLSDGYNTTSSNTIIPENIKVTITKDDN